MLARRKMISMIRACLVSITFAFANLVDEQVAYSVEHGDPCSSAIEKIKYDIENRIGARIIRSSMGSSSLSPIPLKTQVLDFTLANYAMEGTTRDQDRAGSDISSSPELTRSYVETILAACPTIASVTFSYYEWGIGWSLFPGGILRKDVCIDAGRPVRWGEIPCL
jgi:hypothetical protein